jgi:hypothetical protein
MVGGSVISGWAIMRKTTKSINFRLQQISVQFDIKIQINTNSKLIDELVCQTNHNHLVVDDISVPGVRPELCLT